MEAIYETNRDLVIDWTAAGGTARYRTALPEGIAVRRLEGPQGSRFVVDEFPRDVFPSESERHDAEHYGVDVPEDALAVR